MTTSTIVFAVIILVSFILTNLISNRFIKNRSNTGLFILKRVLIFMAVYLVLFTIYYLLFQPKL